jgi:UDP-N-acetylglucosamine:LPS N-acetylglucosamine transferase
LPVSQPKKILITPLDWGAGHTTRCIPLAAHLMQTGHKPIVAGNEAQMAIIDQYFNGSIDTIYTPGYDVTYSGLNKVAQAGLLLQTPRLLKTIGQENIRLREIVRELRPDGIISDNRYGMYHTQVPSVIMTHQLRIQSGMGNTVDNVLQRLHYRYLNKFGATWVVDTEESPGLAGTLSHPMTMPDNYHYIGLLSRFAGMVAGNQKEDGPILVLISGPEPQRTEFSKMLWQHVMRHDGPVIFAEGSEAATAPAYIPAHISYHKRMDGPALSDALMNASIVVCRSGYSTLMDLRAMNKRGIVIPTPGQTEQQYLGSTLHERGIFYSTEQKGFDLQRSLRDAAAFPFHKTNSAEAFSAFRTVLDNWVNSLP